MSAMNNGISGLNAASSDLDVISNNIANSSTTGYKSTDVQFADVYSPSGTGGGVYVSDVATDYAQGAIQYTTSGTDLAINGEGFFITEDANGNQYYTRAGDFEVDSDGYIVNPQGQNLQGYAVDEDGNVITGTLTDLEIDQSDQAAKETTEASLSANLNSQESAPSSPTFSSSDPDSYNYTTSSVVYDAQGTAQTVSAYYVKVDADPSATPPIPDNSWEVHYESGGQELMAAPVQLVFDESGELLTPDPATQELVINTGAAGDLAFTMDLSGLTQYSTSSSVSSTSQNGYPSGSFNGIQIADDGSIYATYSNGETKLQGVVALATFPNNNGLVDAGNTSWTSSNESGDPIVGEPGSGGTGSLMSGALEMSNVDQTAELVNMMVAQSNYQANSKSISASDEMTQVLMNSI